MLAVLLVLASAASAEVTPLPAGRHVIAPATSEPEADLAVEILPTLSPLPGPGAMLRITNFGPGTAGPVSISLSSDAVDWVWAQVSGVSCTGNPAICTFEELPANQSTEVIASFNNIPYGERVELVATVSAANDPNSVNDSANALIGNQATFACGGLEAGSQGVIRFAFAEPWAYEDSLWTISSSAPGVLAVPHTAVIHNGDLVVEVTATAISLGKAVVTAGFGWTQKWITIEVLADDPGCVFDCVPPVLITEPAGGDAVCDGGSAAFSATAQGTAPISWQWYAWELVSGSSSSDRAISTATTQSLAVPCPGAMTTLFSVRASNACGAVQSRRTTVWEGPAPPTSFYTLPPCRVIDTRGGFPLAGGTTRQIPAARTCGIPSDARSLAVNITVIPGTSRGFLTAYPAGGAISGSSTINYSNGKIRANNAVVGVSTDGSASLEIYHYGTQDVNLIIDVNGYFR